MNTNINASQLADIYNMSHSSYHELLYPHRKKLNAMVKYKTNRKGKKVKPQNYNAEQLQYLIKNVLGDTPLGYSFNGRTLIQDKNE